MAPIHPPIKADNRISPKPRTFLSFFIIIINIQGIAKYSTVAKEPNRTFEMGSLYIKIYKIIDIYRIAIK